LTEVEFHTGVADPVAFACRLLGKAYRTGSRVLVTAPAAQLTALDRALWLVDDPSFIPHARLPAPAALLSRSPLWLAQSRAQAADADGPPPVVLINLGADVPTPLEGLSRVIEVVGAEPAERDAGRARWRTYTALGLAIKHHNAAA